MWQDWQGIIPSLLSGLPCLSQVMGLPIVVRTSCLSHLGWQLIASLQWKWLRLRYKRQWQAWQHSATEETCLIESAINIVSCLLDARNFCGIKIFVHVPSIEVLEKTMLPRQKPMGGCGGRE